MHHRLFLLRFVLLSAAVVPLGALAAEGDAKAGSAEKPAATAPAAKPAPAGDDTAADNSPEARAIQKELAQLRLQKNLIDAKLALAEAQRQEAAAAQTAEKARLDGERALRAARTAAESAAQEEEKARIEREIALANAKASAQMAEKLNRIRELETESKIFKTELENALAKSNAEAAKYTADVTSFQKKQEVTKIAPAAQPKLLKEPLVDGVLYISDRRVPLNGPVTQEMADSIIERLNFFNNQNAEFPIFIVIDNSPGGSVAAGFQILKAMESSKAPVYVVVKGFAASMAAVITTLAERSYCYNNTIILHHQMSTTFRGNMSNLEDQLKFARIWYDRLATPVAKKMGTNLEDFTKQMYGHAASGDWQEFGDQAQKLKWVDTVVERIVETGIVDIRPEPQPRITIRPLVANGCEAKVDDKGVPYIQLPVLENPYDMWWIYDKRGLYRAW